MRRGRRYGFSAEQKADIWQRWEVGESLHEIGRALGKDHGSIVFLLSQHGGIAPAVHGRSQRVLTLAQREEIISRGIASGLSMVQVLLVTEIIPYRCWKATRKTGTLGTRLLFYQQRLWFGGEVFGKCLTVRHAQSCHIVPALGSLQTSVRTKG